MIRATALALVTAAALAGCSSSNDAATTTASSTTSSAPATTTTVAPPTTPATDPYDTYLRAAPPSTIARDDAATRAALVCSGAWTPPGGNWQEYPTDWALARAYCPGLAPAA